MDASEDQNKVLKQRVRSLERALAESEALTLAQIECTNRLEQQLQTAQAQVETQTQQLQACTQEVEVLAQRPKPEDLASQQSHIQELQDLIWELERRPSLDQFQILKQQLDNSQLEIETLKLELKRRLDPVKVFELQQEITVLKEYTQQLSDRTSNVIQVQQKYLELRSQYNDLEEEVVTLRQRLAQSEQPTTDPADYERIQAELEQTQQQLADLQQRPDPADFQYVLTELQNLKAELQESQELTRQYAHTCQDLQNQLTRAQTELQDRPDGSVLQQLKFDLAMTQHELDLSLQYSQQLEAQLSQAQHQLSEMEQHPDFVQQQQDLQQLKFQLAELQHRPDPAVLKQAQAEQQQLKLQLAAVQFELEAQRQTLETSQNMKDHLQDQLTQAHQNQADPALVTDLQAQLRQVETTNQLLQTRLAETQTQLQELATVKTQLSEALAEKQNLAQELAQRPTLAQWQEAQRRQELIEAHHVVNQKQVEKLQQRVAELETECVQAHAYAQTQEKEVALLENVKRDLESRMIPLTPLRPVPTATRQPSPTSGIPPISLDDVLSTSGGTDPFSKLKPLSGIVTASVSAPGRSPESVPATRQAARVELPAFVRRR